MPDPLDVPVLAGRFVRLEPLSPAHVDGLLAAATEERSTYGYTRVPHDRADFEQYVAKALANRSAGTQVPFATVQVGPGGGGRVVGSTRYYEIETWDWTPTAGNRTGYQPDGPDTAHIGHTWLAPSAQRSPVNTEAKLLMLTYAFEVWGGRVIRLQTDVRNERSRRAIERLGCQLEGVLRSERPATDGGVRDTVVYSMLASEWPAHRERLAARLAAH